MASTLVTSPLPAALAPAPIEGPAFPTGSLRHGDVMSLQTPVIGSARTVFETRLSPGVSSGSFGPKFEMKLDQLTNSISRKNNLVVPLFDGQASFAARRQVIENAKSSIHLQTFIFNDDETGKATAALLAERAKAGVKVRVIVDGLGSNRCGPELLQQMTDAGVEVRVYATGLDLLAVNNRWHEKHLVVDGKVAIEGGMNIADEYAFGGSGRRLMRGDGPARDAWRDTDVRIEGASVHDVQRAFLRNWGILGVPVLPGEQAPLFPVPTMVPQGPAVRVVQHHPHGDAPDEHTLKLHVATTKQAKQHIAIENAYFVPPRELMDALADAARRGVKIEVLTNSKTSSDMGFVVDAARHGYRELVEAGVKIYEKQGTGTLHAKTLTADGQYSIVGSCNLNGRSHGRDTECVVAINDDKTAAQLAERFAQGLKEAKLITKEELDDASLLTELKQWSLSTLSWTI